MNARGSLGIPMNEAQYAAEWAKSSSKHVSDGDYQWFLTHLPQSSVVLEVGCGSGESALALAMANRKVVAFELNEHCVREAVRNLSAKGVKVTSLPISGLTKSTLDNFDVAIIHADVLDKTIDKPLAQIAFDGIVCWLIGVAPARIAALVSKNVTNLTGQEMATFRQTIHSRCGDLGRLLLPEGGFIHVVDRVGFKAGGTEATARDEAMEAYVDLLAGPFAVDPNAIAFRPIGRSLTSSQMSYVAPSFVVGVPLLISVVAQKSEMAYQRMISERVRAPDIAVLSSAPTKVGRNELCPCGSGKKYKKCHGGVPTFG